MAAGKGDEKQERLKAALRENLKRRKSQARGRVDAGEPSARAPSGERETLLRPDREKD
jgi:hypothetical protein